MPKPDAPVIELSNLTIRRDETTILRNINWRVNRGEHWAVSYTHLTLPTTPYV